MQRVHAMRLRYLLCVRRPFQFLASVVSFLALSACADQAPSLEVQLVTGLVPGREFGRVETSLGSLQGSGAATAIDTAEARAYVGSNYASGRRVAAFAVASGEYDVRTRLLRDDGTTLVEQHTRVHVESDYVLRVHITRDCVGVQCPSPGGSAALTACLNGRCVDPRCSVGAPEFCPSIVFCNSVSECGATSACAEQSCDEGICSELPREGACDSTEWCNPDEGIGCQPNMDPQPESPFPCGTICALAGAPCRFGYWHCEDGAAPFCDALLNRPVGVACDVARVCDEVGECVTPTTSTPAFIVTPTSGLTTTEAGGTATFTVRLATTPSANVYILLSSSDEGEGVVTPRTLSFTAANATAPQTVTVTGVDDASVDGNQPFTITLTNSTSTGDYVGVAVDSVSGTNLDNETPGIVVTPTSGLTTSEAGASATFFVSLQSQPTASVVIPFVSGDLSEGVVSPPSATFTTASWNVPQLITITGVDDAIVDGAQSYTVQVGPSTSTQDVYDGLSGSDVEVSNADNEVPGVVITPTSLRTTTESGGTATFRVALQSQPAIDVRLDLTSTDVGEGTVSPATLTFTSTSWNTQQTVTLTGVDDAIADGDQLFDVILHVNALSDVDYTHLADSQVHASNADNDTVGFFLSTTNLTTNETGTTDTFTVSLRSQPTADVVVYFVPTVDFGVEGTISPSDLTFTTSNWSTAQTVTLTGADDVIADGARSYTIFLTPSSADENYNGHPTPTVFVTNFDDDSPGVTVTPTSGLVTTESGGTATFDLVLNVAPLVNVTISLSSSNLGEGTVSPSSVIFTPLNWSTPRTVTVTGVDDAIGDGTVPYTIVTSATSSSSPAYNGVPVDDVSVVNSDNEAQLQGVLSATNAEGGDAFGFSVGMSDDGNTLVVGAPYERSNVTGINGDATNNAAAQAGAAYIFVRMGSSWTQQAYIKASNTGAADYFGLRVAISDDGNTVAVGAKFEGSNATGIDGDQLDNSAGGAGAAYVFTRSGTTWSQQAYVKASNTSGSFGCAVALSGDGNTLAVGAQYEGHGSSGINGDQNLPGPGGSGAVYVFTRAGITWTQQAYIKASNVDSNDYFGSALAMADDGSTLVVGVFAESSSATGINGLQSDNSAHWGGAAYVFSRVATTWAQQAYIKASNTNADDQFGISVALAADGNTLAVGAYYEDSGSRVINAGQSDNTESSAGAVYIFVRSGATWSQQSYLKTSRAAMAHYFGDSVALSDDGNTLLANSPGESTGAGAGAFYLFGRTGSIWSERLRVPSATNTSVLQWGQTASISSDGSTFVVSNNNSSYPDSVVNVYVAP